MSYKTFHRQGRASYEKLDKVLRVEKKRDAPAGVVIRNSEEVKRGYVGSMYEKYIKSIYQGTYKYFENRQDEANS